MIHILIADETDDCRSSPYSYPCKYLFMWPFLFHLLFSYDLFHIFPVFVYLVSLEAYIYCKFLHNE